MASPAGTDDRLVKYGFTGSARAFAALHGVSATTVFRRLAAGQHPLKSSAKAYRRMHFVTKDGKVHQNVSVTEAAKLSGLSVTGLRRHVNRQCGAFREGETVPTVRASAFRGYTKI